tara:strand:+ start:14555 stop:15166 length:612 start_codon:yes stop_codon:yes gene_type:complete
MKRLVLTTTATAAALFATPVAATTLIDFSGFADGTPITTVSGVTFSMNGGPGTATTPSAVCVFGDCPVALANSDTNDYPTNTFLNAVFDGTASNVRFTFNNFGSGNGSFYSAFDSVGGLLDTGVIDTSNDYVNFIDVTGTGIKTLTWSNNSTDSWIFGVGALEFDALGAVPEPATWAFMIFGFGAIGGAMRRQRKANVKVSYA